MAKKKDDNKEVPVVDVEIVDSPTGDTPIVIPEEVLIPDVVMPITDEDVVVGTEPVKIGTGKGMRKKPTNVNPPVVAPEEIKKNWKPWKM